MTKVKEWFKNSLTIAWARLEVAAGVALGLGVWLSGIDLTPYLGKYAVLWPIFAGAMTELARRRTLKE